jgi:hypothetical protein
MAGVNDVVFVLLTLAVFAALALLVGVLARLEDRSGDDR